MHITLNKTQNNNPKFEQQRDQEDECKKTKGKADNFIKQNKLKKKKEVSSQAGPDDGVLSKF